MWKGGSDIGLKEQNDDDVSVWFLYNWDVELKNWDITKALEANNEAVFLKGRLICQVREPGKGQSNKMVPNLWCPHSID